MSTAETGNQNSIGIHSPNHQSFHMYFSLFGSWASFYCLSKLVLLPETYILSILNNRDRFCFWRDCSNANQREGYFRPFPGHMSSRFLTMITARQMGDTFNQVSKRIVLRAGMGKGKLDYDRFTAIYT